MSQTHWKKLYNPEFLGAYSLEPGKDLVVTIKSVTSEKVTGADGKKEECMVMRFVEPQKPMILNATNAKAIQKLYKTPLIEEWAGKKIQLFVDKVKAFGEVVEALRIRNYVPKESNSTQLICTDCSCEIKSYASMTAEQVAQYTTKKYSKTLCTECAKKYNEEKAE